MKKIICKKCGVEIESNNFCPLCGSSQNDINKDLHKTLPAQEGSDPRLKNKLWFLDLFSFFAAAGIIIVVAVDFAYSGHLTWSRLPLVGTTFAWLLVFLIYHLIRKPYLLVILETINFLALLWFLDRFIPAGSWFINLAFPIILVIGILFLLVILWIRSFQLSTLKSLSVGTLAAGLFLICLEIILHRFQQGKMLISWSLVVFACILPISGMFLYLQKRLNKQGNKMKKYFHF